MTIVAISDTHGLHDELRLTSGDLLIHAGDITEYGTEEEVIDFLKWFERQPFTYKIFIAGNHDLFFETCSSARLKRLIPQNINYLQNSYVEINGFKIFGSPVTPYFLGMAFNKRDWEIKKVWNKIPKDIDILITHGPPKGILDNGMGCEDLFQRAEKIKPILHIFGHIHEHMGMQQNAETCFINTALVNSIDPFENLPYKIIGKPIKFIIEEQTGKKKSV